MCVNIGRQRTERFEHEEHDDPQKYEPLKPGETAGLLGDNRGGTKEKEGKG